MFWRLHSSFPCYSLQKNEFYVTVTEAGKQGYIVVFHATLCKRWVLYHSYRIGKMDAEIGLWMRDTKRCLESKALRKYDIKTLMTKKHPAHRVWFCLHCNLCEEESGERRDKWETSRQGSRTPVSRYRMMITALADV